MTILTLQPGVHDLEYAIFTSEGREAVRSGRIEEYRSLAAGTTPVGALLEEAAGTPEAELVAIRVASGGTLFRAPALATPETIGRLEGLVEAAPLHLPATIELIREYARLMPATPIVLVFETSYFAELPERESAYGIDVELAGRLAIRKLGYHGIFHKAAGYEAARWLGKTGRSDTCILSICLEPQPEVAASRGGRPFFVTGGATPLEGIPGESTCGEIDPSIPLMLAQDEGWGPEQIDQALTHESGLSALAGRRVTVGEVVMSGDPALAAASGQLRYRLLQAAGTALAALGRLDVVVFSGRYARAGSEVGPWLCERLRFPGSVNPPLHWLCFEEGLPRLVADRAAATLLAEPSADRASLSGSSSQNLS